ncbi:YTH domain-containing family protein [Artemisia annua]|uniref:YTH domain-containing family protein n=1 Tax=Artemisia annua TaxID=35608 RepID=A0A2U1MJN3_ARTAN|nr:YTH domain-containing family protein [Artemisia annua]
MSAGKKKAYFKLNMSVSRRGTAGTKGAARHRRRDIYARRHGRRNGPENVDGSASEYNGWSLRLMYKEANSCYEEAHKYQVKDEKAVLFLCFSVIASAKFCGVGFEYTCPLDVHKDGILSGSKIKCNGSFPVKVDHIIKDVRNPHFRHIILENNEHKPVTNPVILKRLNIKKVYSLKWDEKSGKDNHIDTSDSNVSTFANGKPTEDDVICFSSLAISPAQKENKVTGATSVSAVSTTDSDNVLTVGSMPVNPKHNGFAESSGFLTVGTIPLDPKALKVKEASASAEIGLRKNSMEGVSVCDSLVNQPESERLRPLPLTKEEITALNNFTVTFEHARSLFDVDLPTFKAKLMEFNILVWNEPDEIPLRIHGGDYVITIVINKISTYYRVKGTDSFSTVTNMIKYDLNLRPGGYELTYKQPQTSTYNLLKTDLDWHYAAEGSKLRGYFLRLNLNTNDEQTVALMGIYDECIRDHVHDSDYAPYDELPSYCLPNEDASYKDAYAFFRAAYDEYASHEYSSDEYSSDDEYASDKHHMWQC